MPASRTVEVAALVRQAVVSMQHGDHAAAESACNRALDLNGKDVEANHVRSWLALERGDARTAQRFNRVTIRLAPRNPSVHYQAGRIHAFQGEASRAIEAYKNAIRLKPDFVDAVERIAELHERELKDAEALETLHSFEANGALTPGMAAILGRLALRAGHPQRAIELAEEHLPATTDLPIARRSLLFLKGKSLDTSCRWEEAFAAYEEANNVIPARFNVLAFEQYIQSIEQTCTRSLVESLPRPEHATDLPVFVVGMPRTGSTLVEQILDAHPSCHGAGESGLLTESSTLDRRQADANEPYPHNMHNFDAGTIRHISKRYLSRLARLNRGAARIVDKNLDHYLQLGFIAALFPACHIISCRRNPLDACLSAYFQAFSTARSPYASDLYSLGRVYRLCERLIAHWRRVLDLPILDVEYEQLVTDQNVQTRRLVSFCEVPWNDACLQFHQSDRLILTASYEQVNKPMYQTSIGRHKYYEPFLEPLRKGLEAS